MRKLSGVTGVSGGPREKLSPHHGSPGEATATGANTFILDSGTAVGSVGSRLQQEPSLHRLISSQSELCEVATGPPLQVGDGEAGRVQ